jgi:hypothetical protein
MGDNTFTPLSRLPSSSDGGVIGRPLDELDSFSRLAMRSACSL